MLCEVQYFVPLCGPTGENDDSTAQDISSLQCDGQKRGDALQKENQGKTSPP